MNTKILFLLSLIFLNFDNSYSQDTLSNIYAVAIAPRVNSLITIENLNGKISLLKRDLNNISAKSQKINITFPPTSHRTAVVDTGKTDKIQNMKIDFYSYDLICGQSDRGASIGVFNYKKIKGEERLFALYIFSKFSLKYRVINLKNVKGRYKAGWFKKDTLYLLTSAKKFYKININKNMVTPIITYDWQKYNGFENRAYNVMTDNINFYFPNVMKKVALKYPTFPRFTVTVSQQKKVAVLFEKMKNRVFVEHY